MEIHILHIDDWIKYLDLRIQLGGYKSTITKDIFIRKYLKMKDEGSTIYVGTVDGKIVSTAKLIIETKFFDNVGQIEDVVVDKDHRHHGYGSLMVQYLIDVAKQKNCYKVILLTKDNLENFYTKSGLSLSGISMTKFI